MKDLQKSYQDWHKEQTDLSSEFVSAWLDNRGRPCCFGIFDEGYPQSVTMEYLTMENKQWLYQILQKTLDKLKTDSNDKSRRCVMDTNTGSHRTSEPEANEGSVG